jgi:hypothetical protein
LPYTYGVSKLFWLLLVVIVLLWFIPGLFFMYSFTPIDFYGDGAWYTQAALRWLEGGWPTSLVPGTRLIEEVGWGFFTPWFYLSALVVSFKGFGVTIFAIRLVSMFFFALALLPGGAAMGLARKDRWPESLVFLLLLLLIPLSFTTPRAERPETMAMFWITISAFLVLLPKKRTLNCLGYFILPMAFWIHQMCIFLSLSLLAVTGFYYIRKRKFGREALLLLSGIALVAGVSLVASLIAGKIFFQEVIACYSVGITFPKFTINMYVVIPVLIFMIIGISWCIGKVKTDLDKDVLKVILVGLVLIPMIISARPSRIYQFTFPLIFLMLYLAYLYLSSISRRFSPIIKAAFLAAVLIFTGLLWWKKGALRYLHANPAVMSLLENFYIRNRGLILSADTIYLTYGGESYIFWLLPDSSKPLVRRFWEKPIPEGSVALVTDNWPMKNPCMQAVDSVDLGFYYSCYDEMPFRKVSLYVSRCE